MSIAYTEITEGQTNLNRIKEACFAPLYYGNKSHDIVRYYAVVKGNITRPMAEAYGQLLLKLFSPNLTYKIVDFNENFHHTTLNLIKPASNLIIEWDVKVKGLIYKKSLVPLTACRLVEEYSQIIELWSEMALKTPKPTDSKLFKRLQEIHVECAEGKIKNNLYPYGFSGHGLMNFRKRTDKSENLDNAYCFDYGPITIKQFRTRFADVETKTVLGHFRKFEKVIKPNDTATIAINTTNPF